MKPEAYKVALEATADALSLAKIEIKGYERTVKETREAIAFLVNYIAESGDKGLKDVVFAAQKSSALTTFAADEIIERALGQEYNW